MTVAEPAIYALVTAIVGYLTLQIERVAQVLIDKGHREALQSALANAAIVALREALRRQGSTDLHAAVGYVRQSVPDAVKRFDLDDNQIVRLLQPHIERKKLTP